MVKITTPLTREAVRNLKAGDSCLISGVIYTARDAAHKRLCELAAQGKELPLDVKDRIIYFVGPTPAKPGGPAGTPMMPHSTMPPTESPASLAASISASIFSPALESRTGY